MLIADRRSTRSPRPERALRYQLDACRKDSGIEAMVVADVEGFALAYSGDPQRCDELAARLALELRIARRGADGEEWVTFGIGGQQVLVGAAGGTASARQQQLSRGLEGARRILAA